MQRAIAFFTAAALVGVYAACAKAPVPFHQMRTPSGDFCSDMPIFAGRDQPEKEFHRLGPVKTASTYRTVAERLEALRKAACEAQADAVIEASEDEVRNPDATVGKVASGTAVVWIRHPDKEGKPLGLGSVLTSKKSDGESGETEPETTATAKEPVPINTGVEVKSPPPPEPKPTASAEPAPTTTTTTKTTTKTKTKTK